MRFKNAYADKFLSYDEFEVDRSTSEPLINDDIINFIIRVILENKYERIVEIGAYDLKRSFHYKKLFPEIEVIGLDKISGFNAWGVKNGVESGPFGHAWFEDHKGSNTLVVACGTHSYFKPEELPGFFQILFDNGYDLALAELGSHFAKTVSLRRSHVSFYHPYSYLLNKGGFAVDGLIHPNHAFSLSAMERREYFLAKTVNIEGRKNLQDG